MSLLRDKRQAVEWVRERTDDIKVAITQLIAMHGRLIEGAPVEPAEKMRTLSNVYIVVNTHPSFRHQYFDSIRAALQRILLQKQQASLAANASADAAAPNGGGGGSSGDAGPRQKQVAALQRAIQELEPDNAALVDNTFRTMSIVTRILDSRETDWSGIPLNVAHPSTMQPTASTIQSSRDCGLDSVVGGGTCAPTVSDGDDDSDGASYVAVLAAESSTDS